MLTLLWHGIEFLPNSAPALLPPPLPPHSQPQLLLSLISLSSAQCFQTRIVSQWSSIWYSHLCFPFCWQCSSWEFSSQKTLTLLVNFTIFSLTWFPWECLSQTWDTFFLLLPLQLFIHHLHLCTPYTDNYLLKVYLAHLWLSKEWRRGQYREEKEVKIRVRREVEKMGTVAWLVKYTRMRLSNVIFLSSHLSHSPVCVLLQLF